MVWPLVWGDEAKKGEEEVVAKMVGKEADSQNGDRSFLSLLKLNFFLTAGFSHQSGIQ